MLQYKIDTEEQTGKTTLICTTTDAEGRISNTYTDALGRTIATENIVNGEPIRVVNTYDALSRVVEVLHPNEHISTYKYDMLGNIIETKTPDAGTVTAEYTPQGQILSRTTANGEVVSYNYDFERLKSVAYSLHPNDSIVYTYGDTLSENFQKGRLLSVTYPMGSEEYTYGNMGEVVKTVKTIVIDDQIDKVHTYTSEFEYDSWNRIQKMTYPDGEVVDYEYYTNGELKAITGEKDGNVYPYLLETGYHESGQTAYRKLGNNTEHRYFYDKKNRLQLATLHIGSEKISENTYNYDKVDNITGINDNNTYYQAYIYDELNRLIGAKGSDNDTRGVRSDYSMTMEYNKMSSPVVFNQSITTDKGTTFKNNTYLYNQDSQPNAPIQIGNMRYTYDKAGNPTSVLDANAVGRDMVWDAENRLKEIIDTEKGLFHSYAYDHTGERILKRYGTAQNAYYNGKDMGTLYDFGESYSAYASAYFVESNNGYTKHYYAGATRLVSKLGEDYYENNELVPTGKEEKEQYFYFQDHLGSSTYITDLNGDIAQYTAYTPYGEMFREYRNVTPYRFNGKELDTETGLYYYGARYYNPSTALWLGVDPLAYTNPHASPYIYCLSNPINLIDPDGRKEYSYSEAAKNWDKFDSENDHIGLNEVSIVRQAPRYDQPYGQTITGGIGDGVETTSKYKGPSIDASQFSYPFGGGKNSPGEFKYNIFGKIFALLSNIIDNSSSNGNKNITAGDKNNDNFIRTRYKTVVSGVSTINGVHFNYTMYEGMKIPTNDTILHTAYKIKYDKNHNIIDTIETKIIYDAKYNK